MTLKWMSILVAAVAVTLCVTANVAADALSSKQVPAVVNMVAVATAAVATVLAVIGDLYDRVNARINALTDFLIARLNELDTHTGDRNAGFVEGYLLSHNPDDSVVPITSRLRSRAAHSDQRAMTGGDD